MTPLQNSYLNIKTRYPNAIVWFVLNGFVECFSECAIVTSKNLNTTLTKRPDNKLPLTGFKIKYLDKNLKTMIAKNHQIAIVSLN